MSKAVGLAPLARLGFLVRAVTPWRLAHAYQREVLLVAAIGLSAFYWTALASFTPIDASWVAVKFPEATPENLAGTLGANLSGLALFVFGLVAWLLPLPLLTSAVMVVRKNPNASARSRLAGWILGMGCLAALAALQFPLVTWRGFDFPSGGVVGTTLAKQLIYWLGKVGGLIAVGTIALTAVLMVFRKSLIEPFTRSWEKPLWWDEILHRKPKVVADAKDKAIDRQDEPEVDSSEPEFIPALDVHPTLAQDRVSPEVTSYALEQLPVEPEETYAKPASKTPPPRARSNYSPPPLSVFNKADASAATVVNQKDLEKTASLLVKTFEDFGVTGKIIGFQPGPVVTVFEYQPEAGIKQSKVVGLIDDLALALKVDSIFIHPVRGKSALGVQVPNTKREPVHLGDILATSSFKDSPSPLTFGMGKTINGQPMCADLTSMPHLLVAGATGSGKSVAINSMLCSIIMKANPDDVRMILVDPKMLELSIYEGIPHLLMPVITEPTKASLALKWAIVEMERRYKLMQLSCVRNIAGFNEFWAKASSARKGELKDALDDETLDRLPYIVLVIDELADLMMTAPKDVETSIQRLAQKARASGIHMVLATQRPSVDIITGVIKANLPCRIAFQVVSKHDSRTILDLIGAEKLLGKGDMLLQRPGIGRLERLQGALITDEEVLNLVANVKATSPVHYDKNIIAWIDDEFARHKEGNGEGSDMDIVMDDDPKFEEAMALARAHGVVSASFLQRHLKIGYNRAARIVEFMESKGFVDKADGAKPRKWLGPVGA